MAQDLAPNVVEGSSAGAVMPSREAVKRMCLEQCDEMTTAAYEHPRPLSPFDWGVIVVTGVVWIVLTYAGIFMS